MIKAIHKNNRQMTSHHQTQSEFIFLVDGSRGAAYGQESSSLHRAIEAVQMFKAATQSKVATYLWGWYSIGKKIDVESAHCLDGWVPSPIPSVAGAIDIMQEEMDANTGNKRFIVLSDGDHSGSEMVSRNKTLEFLERNKNVKIDFVLMPSGFSVGNDGMEQFFRSLKHEFPSNITSHNPKNTHELHKVMTAIKSNKL